MTVPGMGPGPGIEARLRAAGLPPLPRTAWLDVDLERLAANVAAIRAALPRSVLLEAVVKADAYGHGALPVAVAAVEAGARGLCVATLDEALVLRRAGLGVPLLVLFPIPPTVPPLRREPRSTSRPGMRASSSGRWWRTPRPAGGRAARSAGSASSSASRPGSAATG